MRNGWLSTVATCVSRLTSVKVGRLRVMQKHLRVLRVLRVRVSLATRATGVQQVLMALPVILPRVVPQRMMFLLLRNLLRTVVRLVDRRDR